MEREAFYSFLNDVFEPSLTSRSEILRDRLDAALIGTISFPSREPRENADERSPIWVTREGFEEMRRQWRKKLTNVFEVAFGLRVMLERSSVDYFYDFPAYSEGYKASFMETVEPRVNNQVNKVCLCLRSAISSRPKSLHSPRAPAENIVPALVLLL